MGNGMVIDAALFKAEAEALENAGINLKDRLLISNFINPPPDTTYYII